MPTMPPERQAAVGDPLQLQAVEQGEDVAAEVVERVRAAAAPVSGRGRGGRSARRGSGGPGPATCGLPHGRARADGAAEHDDRARRRARRSGGGGRRSRSSVVRWLLGPEARARSMKALGGAQVRARGRARRRSAVLVERALRTAGSRPARRPTGGTRVCSGADAASRRSPVPRPGRRPRRPASVDDGLGHDQPAGAGRGRPACARRRRRAPRAGRPTARPRRR